MLSSERCCILFIIIFLIVVADDDGFSELTFTCVAKFSQFAAFKTAVFKLIVNRITEFVLVPVG